MRRGRLCAGLLTGALCLSACGSTNSADAQVTSTGMEPHAAVARVLASLGDATVQGVDVIPAPGVYGCGSPCLRVRLKSSADHGVHEVWLGQLIEGAVAEMVRTNNQKTLAEVLGAEVVTSTPRGHLVTTPLGMGYSPLGHHFNSPSDADLRQHATDIAAKYGLKVDSVEVLHPLDSALAVTLTVPRGAVSWTLYQLTNDLLGSPIDVEGLSIQLNSPTGRPLLHVANGERATGGGGWFAPGQADRFGFQHG
jgi:hypothetical protein